MASILNTGISALNAFQRQLSTTGHNIANVNTEGYSRQRVALEARPAQGGGSGYIGSGVEVSSVRRTYDDYLAGRVRSYTSLQQEQEVFHERASQVDNVIADAAAGLDTMMQDFFASIQDVSADPTSIPARNVMLNRSELLVDRFQALNGWMDDLRLHANRDFGNYVEEINGIGQAIGAVNNRIQSASAGANTPPNDLLDERDRLIDELSGYVSVSTLSQDDGSTSVFIGTGQNLVIGTNVNSLVVTNNSQATDHKEVSISLAGGSSAVITDQVSGGKLGGLLRFRNEVLDPAQNSLGLVAIGLAQHFNEEHVTGMDLDGDLGGNYFAVASPETLGDPGNTGTVSVTFNDVSDVLNHEYRLSYNGAAWEIDDLNTGTNTVLGAAGPFTHDGLDIAVGVGPAAGDVYRLRPARQGASAISTLVNDTRDIAAAEAVRTMEASVNTGTGHIGEGAQLTSTGTSMAALPVTLSYDTANLRFDIAGGGTIAYNPAIDSGSTLTVTIAGLGDFSFEMSGTPANGDVFTLEDNSGGVGDNRNALRLAALQNSRVLFGDTASLADAYGYMVADIGTQTHQAGSNADVQEQLLTQAQNAKSAVSGVNLDEEAADLVRFQQAYSAAAQVIATANTLFDTLLGAVRR